MNNVVSSGTQVIKNIVPVVKEVLQSIPAAISEISPEAGAAFQNIIDICMTALPVLMDGQKVNEERLNELMQTLKLTGRENHLPNQLSGGQQQRVSIGRALMNAPAVVLADEPTGNLDSKNSQEIVDLLKHSNVKYGQTLIIITHDENIALQADRIIGIEDGKITRDEVIRR